MSLPQLLMLNKDLSKVPPLVLPDGFSMHTHVDGRDDAIWEELIESSFGSHFSFDGFIRNGGGYSPENVIYICKDGKEIATTTAMENDKYPGHGWFRMVATSPSARGMGAGRMVNLAALNSLKDRGYKTAMLSTDDARIPAICLYLSMGFEPYMSHESHEERWAKVMENIKNLKK